MNPSEQFESFDDAEYPDLAEREYVLALEAECIEEESVGEYIDAVRDFYESGPRFGPSMSRMRYIAELVAQRQGETEATEGEVMSTACVEAFYSGEVLAFDVAKQWKDEYFPEAAVDIFDEAISEMMERHSAYGLPEDERLQVTRDETKAQLVTDGVFVPVRPLEAMVKGWAQRIYGESNEGTHMMMGFRYVLQQINQREIARDDLDQLFIEIMEDNDMDEELPRTESINDIRDGILAVFNEQRASLSADDLLDESTASHDATSQYTYAVERYMRQQDALLPTDDIVASGPVTYVVYDDAHPGETIELLSAQEVIEGEFVGVEVRKIPVMASRPDVRRLAPVIVIKRATVANTQAARFAEIPQDKYLAIVLSGAVDIAHYE